VERDADEEDGNDKGHTPTPRTECLRRHRILDENTDQQRSEQTERGGDLNEAGVEAALLVGHVLGDVNSRAAVLTTERESLKHTNQQENDRRRDSDRCIRWQETNR